MSQKVGVTVKDVPAQEFVQAYAQHLKRSGKIRVPKWSDLVKTATYKELSPYDPDWYYIRAGTFSYLLYSIRPLNFFDLTCINNELVLSSLQPPLPARSTSAVVLVSVS